MFPDSHFKEMRNYKGIILSESEKTLLNPSKSEVVVMLFLFCEHCEQALETIFFEAEYKPNRRAIQSRKVECISLMFANWSIAAISRTLQANWP